MSTVTALEFKDGDDGSTYGELENINILALENGYLVKVSYEEREFSYVFNSKQDMLAELGAFL